jgi:hypothetical protein
MISIDRPPGSLLNDMTSRSAFAMLLLPFLPSGAAFGGDASLEDLRQRCEAAREARLAPLREQAIEDCVSRPRSTQTRAQCVELYRDIGQGGGTVGGGFRAPMFIDVPECQAYFAEQDRQSQAGSGRSRR